VEVSKRTIGLISATFIGISSIIGSGWLFAAYRCAVVAGPASIFSWIIGALVICLLAMCFAEIAVLYPKRGVTAIIPTISHNKFFGFPFAISNWLGVVAVVALEAEATIQYLINLFPNMQYYFYHDNQLTLYGNLLSILLVCSYCLLNYYGVKILTKTNNILSTLKVLIPVITAVIIISAAFHHENFTVVGNNIIPYGYKSIFTAILTSGIIVSFNGFQTIVAFSSDIKNPGKVIPISLLLAIMLCFSIYLLLQIGFIGGLPTELLAQGWKNLEFNAPIVQLVAIMGIGFLIPVIYFGATIAPSGTALTFTGAATNMSTAMAKNQQLPSYFSKIHPIYKTPRRALLLNAALAIIFLFLFRSWGEMAEILSLFHVVSYLPIPIALYVFRNTIRRHRYYFHLPLGRTIAISLFVFFTYLFTMANFRIATELVIMLAIFQIIFITLNVKTTNNLFRAIKQCWILVIYFITILFFVWISPNNKNFLNKHIFDLLVLSFGTLSFLVLSKTETGDVEIINAAVNIYKK